LIYYDRKGPWGDEGLHSKERAEGNWERKKKDRTLPPSNMRRKPSRQVKGNPCSWEGAQSFTKKGGKGIGRKTREVCLALKGGDLEPTMYFQCAKGMLWFTHGQGLHEGSDGGDEPQGKRGVLDFNRRRMAAAIVCGAATKRTGGNGYNNYKRPTTTELREEKKKRAHSGQNTLLRRR